LITTLKDLHSFPTRRSSDLNFYEVPTEIVKKREIEVDENGKGHYVYKDKEVVSRKKDVIAKAMENSQLFQSKFDLIIIDEAHRLDRKSTRLNSSHVKISYAV